MNRSLVTIIAAIAVSACATIEDLRVKEPKVNPLLDAMAELLLKSYAATIGGAQSANSAFWLGVTKSCKPCPRRDGKAERRR